MHSNLGWVGEQVHFSERTARSGAVFLVPTDVDKASNRGDIRKNCRSNACRL
ncbi:MAG: hypothetical protein ACTSQJ_05530 [Promethearchaeota archaeon]